MQAANEPMNRVASKALLPPAYPSEAAMPPGDGHETIDPRSQTAIAEHTEIGARVVVTTETEMPRADGHSHTVDQASRAVSEFPEIGAVVDTQASRSLPQCGAEAKYKTDTETPLPPAAALSPDGASPGVDSITFLPQAGEVHPQPADHATCDLTGTISELIALQRQRTFCIVSQSRSNRSIESFVAKLIGMGPITPEGATQAEKLAASKVRKAVFAQASAVRKAVEKGGRVQSASVDHTTDDLSPAYPLILLAATSREGWDNHRTQVEKRMRSLARTLPVWPFVDAIRGLGELGLAVIVAEVGDLAGYATKERVWKRLGLAVINGERQGRRSDPILAAAHGYSPRRRAEIWTLVDSLFRHQWRGAKEDTPAHPLGRYGAIYAVRKAHTAEREGWTPAHRENDARRIMAKQLIEDLWRAWNRPPAEQVT